MKFCIELLQQALLHLSLARIYVNKQPSLLACFQTHKGHDRNETLSSKRMICIRKETVLAINYPSDSIGRPNMQPTKSRRLRIGLLLASLKLQPTTFCNIDDNIGGEDTSLIDVLSDRLETTFLQ